MQSVVSQSYGTHPKFHKTADSVAHYESELR